MPQHVTDGLLDCVRPPCHVRSQRNRLRGLGMLVTEFSTEIVAAPERFALFESIWASRPTATCGSLPKAVVASAALRRARPGISPAD